MRLTRLAFRGITRFTGEQPVTLDFDAVGKGLVALVGPNGAGKTTALEAVAAALWKSLPSRPGSLYDHCSGRDAFIEAEFVDFVAEMGFGNLPVKVRVQVDAERRTTEGYIFENGNSITTGRAGEFGSEIDRLFGSQELFLASVFAAQNKAGNFLLMAKGDRKALFVELLGLGRLELLNAQATHRLDVAEMDLAKARAVLEAAELEVAALPGLKAKLTDAVARSEAASGRLENARAEEAAAVSALERAKGAGERLEALQRAAAAARREWTAAGEALAKAQALVPQAHSRAEERAREIRGRDHDGQERRARERYTADVEAIQRRVTHLEAVAAEGPKVAAAMRALPPLRAELATLDELQRVADAAGQDLGLKKAALAAAETRLRDADAAADKERERLNRQAGLLEQVPCTAEPTWRPTRPEIDETFGPGDLAGTCPLLAEARAANLAVTRVAVDPAIMQAHMDALRAFGAASTDHQTAMLACDPIRRAEVLAEVQRLDAVAARAPVVEQANRQLAGLAEDRDRALRTLDDELTRVAGAKAQAVLDLLSVESRLKADLEEAALEAEHASDRQFEAKDELEQAEGDLGDAKEAGGLTVPQADADLSRARIDRMDMERALRAADQERAGIEAQVEALELKDAGLSLDRLKVAGLEQAVGDWALLERAFGRDGIQALEIDAAGPEVAGLTNELLAACYGARFSIAFETLREKKSKAGEYTEAFDVKVFDRGHERQVEALSGGEKVVVGEAIGLALSIFNARKSGIRWETLFRDETAGALDPKAATAYVDMLRRALELGGFHQVVFVAHQQEVWERADARFRVEGGTVALEGARKQVEVLA